MRACEPARKGKLVHRREGVGGVDRDETLMLAHAPYHGATHNVRRDGTPNQPTPTPIRPRSARKLGKNETDCQLDIY